MSRDEQYRRVRAVVRRLGCRDSLYAIWAYSLWLQVDGFQFPDEFQVHSSLVDAQLPQAILPEFTLEQIAREVIRHADIVPRRGLTLRQWDPLADIITGLRSLENEIYAEFKIGKHIHLELMRITHRQLVWQQFRFHRVPVIRYYKLFNTPLIDSYAQNALGLTLKEIYTIGMCYLGHFLEAPRVSRVLDIEIPGLTQDHFQRFLAFTSLPRNALAERLRAEHSLDEDFGYRFSSLREFPMVGMSYKGRDEFACPIPTLLLWRITTGLYYSLKDIEGFFNEFGSSFQRYVGEVLRARVTSGGRTILAEVEYHVGKNRKHTVDWIVQQGDEAALFIECKTKRMTWASKAGITDLAALQNDLDVLAAAVVQVYKTIVDYRANSYPQLPFAEERQVFPMVVTLEDWYFFGNEMPVRLDALVRTRMSEAKLSEGWLDEMPYAILSVDELERAARYFNEVDLTTLVYGRARNNDYSRWGFASYCSDAYGQSRPQLPPLFEEEHEALFANLAT